MTICLFCGMDRSDAEINKSTKVCKNVSECYLDNWLRTNEDV